MMKKHQPSDAEIDETIRQELVQDFELVEEEGEEGEEGGNGEADNEENKKRPVLKVYPKIAGIPNVGRTYFCNYQEIVQKKKEANAQMAMKYGSEIWGPEANLGNQRSGGTKSGTGTVNSVVTESSGGLIECRVSEFLLIPDNPKFKVKESRNVGTYEKLAAAFEKLKKEMKSQNMDDNVINGINRLFSDIKRGSGPTDMANTDIWDRIEEKMDDSKIRNFMASNASVKSKWIATTNAWDAWVSASSGGGENDDYRSDSASKVDASTWNPNMTYRVDIITHFDEDWYKRKFKSGFLNNAVNFFKTSAASYGPKSSNSRDSRDRSYGADEMQPGEKRKLDGIQWKMTNKVAKDFMTLLFGWSRPKEMYANPDEPAKPLQEDAGFGKEMAAKALNNRGVLGRIKQKLFSNQQANNSVSIVFQLADPGDGWKINNREDKSDSGGEGTSVATESSISVVKVEDDPGFLGSATTLKVVSEDGTIEVESDRYGLVKEACLGSEDAVADLIDDVLAGGVERC